MIKITKDNKLEKDNPNFYLLYPALKNFDNEVIKLFYLYFFAYANSKDEVRVRTISSFLGINIELLDTLIDNAYKDNTKEYKLRMAIEDYFYDTTFDNYLCLKRFISNIHNVINTTSLSINVEDNDADTIELKFKETDRALKLAQSLTALSADLSKVKDVLTEKYLNFKMTNESEEIDPLEIMQKKYRDRLQTKK